MLRCCRRPAPPAGVTFVSIGHRPTLLAFHEEVLHLAPGGAWELRPAAGVSLESAVAAMA